MMVGLKRISTALGLLAALASSALAQEAAPNAEPIDRRRRGRHAASSRNLAGYRIEIQARDGVVTLTGDARKPGPESRGAGSHPVRRRRRGVVDQLQVTNERPFARSSISPIRRWRIGQGRRDGRSAATLSMAVAGAPVNGAMIDGGPVHRSDPSGRVNDGGPDARRTGRHGRRDAGRSAWLSQLRVAQLCSLSQLLRGRLPDRLPLASLAEHRTVLPLSGSSARLACRDSPLGRRHLVARLQEALHPAVLHPLSVRSLRLLSVVFDRRPDDDRSTSRLEATRFQPAYFVALLRVRR